MDDDQGLLHDINVVMKRQRALDGLLRHYRVVLLRHALPVLPDPLDFKGSKRQWERQMSQLRNHLRALQ
jgi:hypothetical protein